MLLEIYIVGIVLHMPFSVGHQEQFDIRMPVANGIAHLIQAFKNKRTKLILLDRQMMLVYLLRHKNLLNINIVKKQVNITVEL